MTMAKFHINPATGDPGPCRAKQQCPFGDMESDHYASKEEARAAYEHAQANPAPKKAYPNYGEVRSREIASTIKKQVNTMTYMSLGASNFTAINGGLRFNARILPFNADGSRSSKPSNMIVEIRLNGHDYYDVQVHRIKDFRASTHFEQENVDASSLDRLLFSLDYNGDTVLNPRI